MFASTEAWWVVDSGADPEVLLWAPDLQTQAAPVALDPRPDGLRTALYSAERDRFAVLDDTCTRIGLYDRTSGRRIADAALKRCPYDLAFRGNDLAWTQDDGVWHWRPPAAPRNVLPSARQPDGRAEVIHVQHIGPDGGTLLVRSSRHNANRENHCEGVSNPVSDTYLLDIDSGSLQRIDLPRVELWESTD